jgi:hypothetical protein
MIQHQLRYGSTTLAHSWWSGVDFLESGVLYRNSQPAFVALALAVDLCDGAAGDPKDPLAAADRAEHLFSLSDDEHFP